jgi:hypothetical protein
LPAAIDNVLTTGNVGRIVSREEGNQGGYVRRLRDTPYRRRFGRVRRTYGGNCRTAAHGRIDLSRMN